MSRLDLLGVHTISAISRFEAEHHYQLGNIVDGIPILHLDEKCCFNKSIQSLTELKVPAAKIAAYRLSEDLYDYAIIQELWQLGGRPLGKIAYAFNFQSSNLAGANPTGPLIYTICHVPINGTMFRPYWHLRDDNPRELGWCYGAGTKNRELIDACRWCDGVVPGMSPNEPWAAGTVVLSLAGSK